MAKSINSVVIATDTFSSLITKTNQVISAIGSEVITANSSNDGANTTGNTNLIGIFGANTIAAGTSLRGGSVNAAANLTISSNVSFTGANASFSANLVITNSVVSVNAVTMLVSGPTLNVSSNATFNSNVNISGIRLTVASNANFTGANTTLGSANTTISGNNFTVTSNNFSVTANDVTFTSNTTFDGTLDITNKVTLYDDIQYGPAGVYGIQTSAANTSLGVTLGSPLPVYSWVMANYKGADITSVVKNGATVRVSRFLAVTDGTNAYITEYATLHSPAAANLGVYSITANATHAIINFTQTAINSELTLNISLTA
jgi:hypothetical protein